MEYAKSLDVSPLFPLLHAELVSLLRGLRPEDWERPTACEAWRVRDVVEHLLDGYVRRLSLHRDGHLAAPDRPVEGYKDLVAYLNELNADWVRALAQ